MTPAPRLAGRPGKRGGSGAGQGQGRKAHARGRKRPGAGREGTPAHDEGEEVQELTPRQVVAELDKYVIGQAAAK